jgi:hypothetical protein
MRASEVLESSVACPVNIDVSQLTELAANWLVPMFDPESQLFCHRLNPGPGGMVREGSSHRYTTMTLLGLNRFETTGGRSPIATRSAIDSLIGQYAWINNIGDVGLMLWLFAVAAPNRLAEVYAALRVETALARYREAREVRTMELAWFLTGLAYATLARSAKLANLADVSVATYQLVAKNQGAHGIFGHQAVWKSLRGVLRGRIGSFADQVYPIYALARFAEAYGDQAALDSARRCAEAICRAQGPQGQWWWHYDASTGKVFQKYPVYSVHQHGMGPMALFALGDRLQSDFSEPIYKGLSWIYGNNERGVDFRDESTRVIWRNIHRNGRKLHLGDSIAPSNNAEPVDNLRVLTECRPYELGWLLYAFAGR